MGPLVRAGEHGLAEGVCVHRCVREDCEGLDPGGIPHYRIGPLTWRSLDAASWLDAFGICLINF